MKISQMVKKLLSLDHECGEVPGAPTSLKEYEKQFVRRAQDELNERLQILEVEVEAVSRK